MKLIKTGNYRIVRQIIGISGTKEIISETQSLKNAKMEFDIAIQDTTYNDYYIEEEVYTIGSLIDNNGNPLSSDPYWRPIQ